MWPAGLNLSTPKDLRATRNIGAYAPQRNLIIDDSTLNIVEPRQTIINGDVKDQKKKKNKASNWSWFFLLWCITCNKKNGITVISFSGAFVGHRPNYCVFKQDLSSPFPSQSPVTKGSCMSTNWIVKFNTLTGGSMRQQIAHITRLQGFPISAEGEYLWW